MKMLIFQLSLTRIWLRRCHSEGFLGWGSEQPETPRSRSLIDLTPEHFHTATEAFEFTGISGKLSKHSSVGFLEFGPVLLKR